MEYKPLKDGSPIWKLLSRDPDGTLTWFMDLGDSWVVKTETPVDDLLDDNQRRLNDNSGKRWGDGRIVASVPLNMYYDKLLEPQKQRDRKWLRRWLNDADHRKFRTFSGNV